MSQVLSLSQVESMGSTQHCWRNMLFGAKTQHLIPWPTLGNDGTHCGTNRSPMWPRSSEQNYKLSLGTCKSISALHPQDSSLRLFSLPCSPDTSTEAMCNFFQFQLFLLLKLKHHFSHLPLRPSDEQRGREKFHQKLRGKTHVKYRSVNTAITFSKQPRSRFQS